MKQKIYNKIILMSTLFVIILFMSTQLSHFSSRLIGVFKTSESDNPTSLVWLNGWSQAIEHLNYSSFLGVGPNRMGDGELSFLGNYSNLIMSVTSSDTVLNSFNGSFLFSKVVSEFGLFGIILFIYIFYISLKKIYKIHVFTESHYHFFIICFTMFILLSFFRATSYLSIISILVTSNLLPYRVQSL